MIFGRHQSSSREMEKNCLVKTLEHANYFFVIGEIRNIPDLIICLLFFLELRSFFQVRF